MWKRLEEAASVNQVNLNKDERWLSLAGGTLLLLYALIRIPFTAVLAFLGAVYLYFRGIRGFCYLYDLLGRNTAVQLPKADQSQVRPAAISQYTALPELSKN